MNYTESFGDRLSEWTDEDITLYYLACSIGLLRYKEDFSTFREAKHIFWTQNETRERLKKILDIILDSKFIEFDDDGCKYRRAVDQ
jgi:hypothetical protein